MAMDTSRLPHKPLERILRDPLYPLVGPVGGGGEDAGGEAMTRRTDIICSSGLDYPCSACYFCKSITPTFQQDTRKSKRLPA